MNQFWFWSWVICEEIKGLLCSKIEGKIKWADTDTRKYFKDYLGCMSVKVEVKFCCEKLSNSEIRDGSSHNTQKRHFRRERVIKVKGKGKVGERSNGNDGQISSIFASTFYQELNCILFLDKVLIPLILCFQFLDILFLFQAKPISSKICIFEFPTCHISWWPWIKEGKPLKIGILTSATVIAIRQFLTTFSLDVLPSMQVIPMMVLLCFFA